MFAEPLAKHVLSYSEKNLLQEFAFVQSGLGWTAMVRISLIFSCLSWNRCTHKKRASHHVCHQVHRLFDVRLIFRRHWVILAIWRQVSVCTRKMTMLPPSWFCAPTTCFTCSFFIFNFCILFPPQLVLCAHDMFYGWPYINSPSCHIPSSFQVLYHHHGHCHHHHHDFASPSLPQLNLPTPMI